MLYCLYRAGRWLARLLPLSVSYAIAVRLADWHCRRSQTDCQTVQRNLAAILGDQHPDLANATREVFRNFGKYLVDFFRQEVVDQRFIARRVAFTGREHLEQARRRGRGAILLSAHLGNYELGAAVAATAGYPMNAIVLNHQDPRIDRFFARRRGSTGVKPIAVGMALREGYRCLRRNELLGIVADRDFFNNGIRLPFLGRTISVPKGPAIISLRTGAPIVPAFLVREEGERYRMIFESPIVPDPSRGEEPEIERMTREALGVLERYIRQYPTQWYLFRDFENPGPWVIL